MALSKGFEIATLGSGLDVNQSNGDVVTIDMTTDVISEGSSNLYFSDERVDDRVSSLLVGGSNVGLTYDDTANTLTIALVVTGGLDLSQNDTSDLPEDPSATVTSATMYYTDARVNTFLGGGTATTLTTTGNVTVGGDLTVSGTQTTLNTASLSVEDLNITVASGATDAASANGAGITVAGINATILYDGTNDEWDFNKITTAPGFVDTTLNTVGNVMIVGANKRLDDTGILVADTVNTRIGIGVTDPTTLLELGSQSALGAQFRISQNNNGADGPNLVFYSSRGTRTTTTALQASDEILKIEGFGRGATTFVESVRLEGLSTDASANATFDIQTRTSNTLASRIKVEGTGATTLNGAFTFPTTDGTSNQVLSTDGSGALTWNTLDTILDWNVSSNYAYQTITDGATDANATANNDTFKMRGGDQIEINIQNNDATHGDNVLIGHTDSGVTAQSYGGNTAIPVFTVDAQGHVTTASTTAVSTTWTASDGTTTQDINNGDTVLFDSGTDISVTVSATDQIQIAHNVTGANTTVNVAANTFLDEIVVTSQGHVTSVGSGTIDFNVADNYAYKTFTDGANNSVASSNEDTFTITDGDQIEATISNDTLTLGHTDSGVTAGSAGSGTSVPVITVDAQGHITSLSAAGITTSWTITDGSTSQTIEGGNTLTVVDGTDINAVVSATDTLTINNTSTLDTVTGRGNTTTNDINVGAVFTGDSTGANSISDGGVSIGAGNDFNLYHYLGTNYIRATGQIIMNAPDDFRIRNGSSDWFKVEGSNGYVGIGNSTPTNPLHIRSTATGGTGIPVLVEGRENPFRGVRYNAGADGAVLFLEHSRSNTLGTAAALNDNDQIGMLAFRAYNSSNSINNAADINAFVDGATGTHTPSELHFRTQSATGTSNKMVMRADGDVGIGTTDPSARLHVRKSHTITANTNTLLVDNFATGQPAVIGMRAVADNGGAGNTGAIYFDAGADGSAPDNIIGFNADHQTDTNYDVVIKGNGNVGIGTSNPTSTYGPTTHIYGSNPNIHLQGSGGGSWAYFELENANYDRAFGMSTAGEFRITSDKTNLDTSVQFALLQNGRVGIGTTQPDEILHVQGNIVVEAAGHAAGVYVMQKTIAATASQDIFTISNTHGAQIFQVMFNCSSTNFSVSKMFNVAHNFGNTPVTNKTVDTGSYSSNNFTVNFTDVSSTGIKCAITNDAATASADITVTLILGGSPQAVTLTKH